MLAVRDHAGAGRRGPGASHVPAGATAAAATPAPEPVLAGPGPKQRPTRVSMSSLGSMGQWGNQMFQYLFLKLYSEQHGLTPELPAGWIGRVVLAAPAAEEDGPLSAAALNEWPLAADRTILSHAQWRAFSATREPLRGPATAAPGGVLSGRAVRRLMPQLWADQLAPGADAGPVPAVCGSEGMDLWGWFQFHTSAYAPHRQRIRQLLAPSDGAAEALRRVQQAVWRCSLGAAGSEPGLPDHDRRGSQKPEVPSSQPVARRIVGVHSRVGEGYAPLIRREEDGAWCCGPASAHRASDASDSEQVPAAAAAAAAASAADSTSQAGCGVGAFRDDSGLYWYPPADWYRAWAATAGRELAADVFASATHSCRGGLVFLLCSDGPLQGWRETLCGAGEDHQVLTVQQACATGSDPDAWEALVAAAGGSPPVADWLALATLADAALLVANSTFSLTAALANGSVPPGRVYRPVPAAGGLLPFDVWDAAPLLPAESRARPRAPADTEVGIAADGHAVAGI